LGTLRVAATASVLLLGLTGCAGAGHPAAHPGATGSGQAGQQLTVAKVREVFDAFWPRFEQLAVDYSPGAARRLTAGAELQAQLFFKGTSGPTITRLVNESFYVPRLTGYPRWFWAAGQQAGSGAAGHLFVMVQSASSAPWQTAMALYDLDSSARMLHYLASAITKDAQGYADAVPLSDRGVAVPPSAMSATYASYLNSQGTQAVRRLFQPGLNTTYFISVDREVFRGAGRYGWRDTDLQAPAPLPVYALRVSTGGAVVIFSTYDTAGWTAVSSSAPLPAQPSGIEGNYVPPGFVVQDLGLTSVRAGTRLTVTAVDRVLAFVQPHGVGSINVLINNGAATRVQKFSPAG
jgi:hypothetical protein